MDARQERIERIKRGARGGIGDDLYQMFRSNNLTGTDMIPENRARFREMAMDSLRDRSSSKPLSTIGEKPIINEAFQQLQGGVAPEDFTFVPNNVPQITIPNYPNYRDQSVVNEALKLGSNAAKQKNEEGKETNFIDTLLGDIDFKALAQNPIFQQVMGGLQRMPFNQGQFGDSMLTGFTRGMQQFDAEELAKAKEQAAIDLEQFRYDAQQAASADSIAENRRRYKEGRADKQNTFTKRFGLEERELELKEDDQDLREESARLKANLPPELKSVTVADINKFFEGLENNKPIYKKLVKLYEDTNNNFGKNHSSLRLMTSLQKTYPSATLEQIVSRAINMLQSGQGAGFSDEYGEAVPE